MTTKHTPGPWRETIDSHMVPVVVAGPITIAKIYLPPVGNALDNARLIAAAPDLLAALVATVKEAEQTEFELWVENKSPAGDAESLHRQWEDSSEYRVLCEYWKAPLDAIAKARGEA